MAAKINYARLKATAERLIRKAGRAAVLQVRTLQSAGVTPVYDYEDKPVTIAELGFRQSDIDGTRIKIGDKKFVVSAGFIIDTYGKLKDGTITYEILAVDSKKPGDVTVVQFLHCRR